MVIMAACRAADRGSIPRGVASAELRQKVASLLGSRAKTYHQGVVNLNIS